MSRHVSKIRHTPASSRPYSRLRPIIFPPTMYSSYNDDDQISVFSYDGDDTPNDAFNLTELVLAAELYFGTDCVLERLAEGGYHKVYDILRRDDRSSLGAVARVASPAFPRDKMESEIATLQYIAANTNVPVPEVYTWDSDASNPVGAEYMIMQKLNGTTAESLWDSDLDMDTKKRVISTLAEHLAGLFALRFERSGSLYENDEGEINVGPIIGIAFYHARDGYQSHPDPTVIDNLGKYRGPFKTTTDYLRSPLEAELSLVAHTLSSSDSSSSTESIDFCDTSSTSSIPETLSKGTEVINKALELCAVYPGDKPVTSSTRSEMPFTLKLDDLRLSNIMVNASGNVTGLIDFESTTVAPVWDAASIPRFLLPGCDDFGFSEGGDDSEKEILLTVFLDTMRRICPAWIEGEQKGRPFRELTKRHGYEVRVWALPVLESWVDERLAWAKDQPGVPFPEDVDAEA